MAEEKTEKPGTKVVQVMAAALAAVTAALLGSTLGVAGTVAGAALASVVTTVGGEIYLRSLHRTRELASTKFRSTAISERETVEFAPADPADSAVSEKPAWRRRLPLILGVSAIAFVVALVAITGFEGATGKTFGGGNGTTIGKIVGGGGAKPGEEKHTETPGTTPSTPVTTTVTAPPSTTTQAPPTTSSSPPSTTPSSPSSSAPSTTPSAPSSTPTP
ncbi:hypothetical protein AB5J62_38845 [Amycolatopsis sp. cg5]|uniref:hypothetical protein n=1 Tax=Amycolatopsis sp. cg5 TaxID=3238802 RepID=UPI00352336A9